MTRQSYALALALLGLLVYLGGQDFMLVGDGKERFDSLRGLLAGTPHPVKYSLIGPLFSSPMLLAGAEAVRYFNLVVFLGLGGLWWRLLPAVFPRGVVLSSLILLVSGSMWVAQLPYYMAEPFTVTLTLAGMLLRERTLWAVPLLAVACANTPATLVGLACFSLYHAVTRRNPRILLAPVLAAGLIGLEMLVLRGGVTGYEHEVFEKTLLPYSGLPGFTYPLFFGLLSLTLSFGKGIVFYAPGLWLAPWLRGRLTPAQRDLFAGMAAYIAGLLLVYARWWCWSGDVCWGPRFLLFASLPATLLLALALETPSGREVAGVTLLALALSAWVAINGTVYSLFGLEDFYWGPARAVTFVTWYVPELSPLWHPFVRGLLQVQEAFRLGVFGLFAASAAVLSGPLWARLWAPNKEDALERRPHLD